MKSPQIILSAIVLLTATSCTNSENDNSVTNGLPEPETMETISINKAKDIVAENSFIDYDPEYVNKMIGGTPDTGYKEHPEEFELSKAALYRYYSQLTVTDGIWSSKATKASELNMSERVFNELEANRKKHNDEITAFKGQGIDISDQTPPKEYLEALLK